MRAGTCCIPVYPVTDLSGRESARYHILSEDLLPVFLPSQDLYLLAVELQKHLKGRDFVLV